MADDQRGLLGLAMDPELSSMRGDIEDLSAQLVTLLERRAQLASGICSWKQARGLPTRDRARERELLQRLVQGAKGPIAEATLSKVLALVVDACLETAGIADRSPLLVDSLAGPAVDICAGSHRIGRGSTSYVAGPCSVEDEAQMEQVAAGLAAAGVGFLRAGAFKPRTSPYDFQGLGERGLAMLAVAGRRHGLATVSEATSAANAELVARYADVIQIGARNMANYELLRAVGGLGYPVLLKRGFGATIDEWIGAAEYLACSGTDRILMCERGIRSFCRDTRATLDISAVPLVLARTRLPVIVDVSHAAGRRDILAPLTAAAFAAGAQAVMLEVHPQPSRARSDAAQQIDLESFTQLQRDVASGFAELNLTLRPRPHVAPAPTGNDNPTRAGDPRCA